MPASQLGWGLLWGLGLRAEQQPRCRKSQSAASLLLQPQHSFQMKEENCFLLVSPCNLQKILNILNQTSENYQAVIMAVTQQAHNETLLSWSMLVSVRSPYWPVSGDETLSIRSVVSLMKPIILLVGSLNRKWRKFACFHLGRSDQAASILDIRPFQSRLWERVNGLDWQRHRWCPS